MGETMLRTSLGEAAARNLADVTMTPAQMGSISPRWLLRMLPWVNVDAGMFRVNRVRVIGSEFQRVETRVDGERALLLPENLRAIPLFRTLGLKVLSELVGRFKSRQVPADAVIVQEGEPGDELFIICRGKVEVVRNNPSGERSILSFLRDGDFFGEMALLRSEPRNATVRAVAPTLLLVLSRASVKALMKRHPKALASLEEAAAARSGESSTIQLETTATEDGEPTIMPTFVDYEEHPLEIALSSIMTTLRVHSRATDAYERARATVQRFLGARSDKEIVFVRGTTEAINLVAQSWGRANVHKSDEIVVTHLEHHSNIVPWQLLCEETGAVLRVVPVDDAGDVRLDAYEAMLSPRVKLVALPQVSNAIGTLVPVAAMSQMAHRHGALVLVDGAQSAAHMPVDVMSLGADFFVFSGHKIYGPTGIGVLWGREEILEQMPPWQGGGSMIEDVTFERTTYAHPPARFEAGTPSLADAVGLGAALDYVERAGRPAIAAHEQRLMSSLVAGLSSVSGLSLVGAPAVRVGAVSFVMNGHEPKAIGQYLNRKGIAVRAGHHCAQPILRRFGHETTVRPSLGIYNDESDVALLVRALSELSTGRGR